MRRLKCLGEWLLSHTAWELTGAKVLHWVMPLLVFFGLGAWGYVKELPVPALALVMGAGLVFSYCAISFALKNKTKLTKRQPQAKEEKERTQILQIRFDYLPDSPLNHGWRVSYGGQPVSNAPWTHPADGPPGSLWLQLEAGCAMDFAIEPSASLADRITYMAKYTDTTMIFIRVRMTSPDSMATQEKWIKLELGKDDPRPTAKWEQEEWTLPVSGIPIKSGWREFDLSLPDAVRRTWGTHGWTFKRILTIRIRGRLGISPIDLSESSSNAPSTQ
jgi:hypothetical protein